MPHTDVVVRLLLAAGLGAAIGVERELRQKAAGLRTNILIATGSALFTVISIELAHISGTPDRIAAQVVSGIGFLGAGSILRSGRSVHGMTTAATIWVNAAVGMAAIATIITLIVLAVLPLLEKQLDRYAGINYGRRIGDHDHRAVNATSESGPSERRTGPRS